MFRKTQIYLLFLLCGLGIEMTAQRALHKANLQFEVGAFSLAIENLKEHLKSNPNDILAQAKMAECLYHSGKLSQAVFWFEKFIHQPDVPQNSLFLYAQSLKKTARFDESIEILTEYTKYDQNLANHYIKSSEFAKLEMAKIPDFEVITLPFNSAASDFGLSFYKDIPVFSSFRTDVLLSEVEKMNNKHSGVHKSFYLVKNKLNIIKGLNNKLDHIGPVNFSKDGEICALIESKMTDDCGILCPYKSSVLYLAKLDQYGEIIESKSFSHNEVGSSIQSAQLAYGGQALYFSSNRAGGYGGFDLYVSYYKNNQWTLPQNLGPEINSPGNEITPFYEDGELYFSSDFHYGLGGYDIFKSVVELGEWTHPINMGSGINSIGDDYFPVMNTQKEMLFTSNRLGGKGSDDIYKAIKLKVDAEEIMVFQNEENIPSAFALDDLNDTKGKGDISNSTTVAHINDANEIVKTDFVLPDFDIKIVGMPSEDAWSITSGARRIALNELAPMGEVFFIQLASISSVQPNYSPYRSLVRYGNIYRMNNNRSVKIRLGYYNDRAEAEEVLKAVKSRGFKDAFITFESLSESNMELILASVDGKNFKDEGNLNSKNPTEEMRSFKIGSKYKVRLASYEDPIWFDLNKVKDLGRIEQWTKGSWTIFILAGYEDLDDAKKAQIQAINRGFKTAEVVIDNGGILERLKQN